MSETNQTIYELFMDKYGQSAIFVVIFVVGVLGGNFDRLAPFIPQSEETKVQIEDLSNRISALEDSVYQNEKGVEMDDFVRPKIRVTND